MVTMPTRDIDLILLSSPKMYESDAACATAVSAMNCARFVMPTPRMIYVALYAQAVEKVKGSGLCACGEASESSPASEMQSDRQSKKTLLVYITKSVRIVS